MKRTHHTVWAAMLLVGGCGDDDAAPGVSSLGQAVVMGEHVALIDAEADRAFVLDAASPTIIEAFPIPRARLAPNPVASWPRNGDSDEALILSAGRRGVDSPTVLTALAADASTREFEIEAPFDALAQSPNGERAVAFFQRGAAELLFSPTEFAVIDLESGGNVERRSVRSPGGPPLGVKVSPRMRFDGMDVTVAVIPSTSHVTLLDVDEPARRETVVQLSSGTLVHVEMGNMLFGPEHPRIYMREHGGEDVFVLQLAGREDPGDANRFSTEILQLAAGGAISDMAVYAEAGAERLLAVLRDRDEVRIMDAGTGSHFDLQLDHAATRVILHRAFEGRPVAVLYEEGSHWVSFIDLVAAETGGVWLHSVRLAEPVSDTLGVLEGGLVVFTHGESVLSIIDVADAAIRLLSVNGRLEDSVYDDTLGTLWFAPEGQYLVGFIDLFSGRTDEVLLDLPVQQLVPVPRAGRVMVIHPDARGSVTLLDGGQPRRATALEITHLF